MFTQLLHFEGVIVAWSNQNFYNPISLLDEAHFENKIMFLVSIYILKNSILYNSSYFHIIQKYFVNVFVYRMSIFWEGTGEKCHKVPPYYKRENMWTRWENS